MRLAAFTLAAGLARFAAVATMLIVSGTDVHAETNAEAFSWVQHPGSQLPADLVFHDEAGRIMALPALLRAAPSVLDLGYFHCPSLCGVTRADLYAALKTSGLVPGRDVSVIAISIDPAERQSDAATAKAADLAQWPASWAGGVHYVTGEAGPLAAIKQVVGFRARWDARFKQFMHPAGLVVLTRAGVVSSYLPGVGYKAGDVRAAVLRAGDGGIAQAALPILLLCFHLDETTGRYTLAIVKLLRLLGALTVVTIGGLLIVLSRKRVRAG